MKNLKLATWSVFATVLTVVTLSQSASAEEFTLTRGDGKIFTCSDQPLIAPLAPPAPVNVPLCDCTDEYNTNYGKVVGTTNDTQCQLLTISGRKSKVTGCNPITPTDAKPYISCTCVDDFGIDYGNVLQNAKSADKLVAACKAKGSSSHTPKLGACTLSLF